MKGLAYFLFILIAMAPDAGATTRAASASGTTGYNYNYMYPYMNNQMRTNLNPGVTTSQSTSPIDIVVKTEKLSADRRVVPRKSATQRSASTAPVVFAPTNMRNIPAAPSTTTAPRRVVARSGIRTQATQRATARDENAVQSPARNVSLTYATPTAKNVSSSRCLADYTDCMNDYCERPESAYNRCYCSSKLAQIDSKYQSEIDTLIKEILSMKTENRWSDSEMNEYWESVMGNYGKGNAWTALDQALNINWAATESRVRGQQAFNTGHEYCVQYLQNCYYMSSNLRDAYRSEIARDCAAYETSLQRIKNAAESIIEAYND